MISRLYFDQKKAIYKKIFTMHKYAKFKSLIDPEPKEVFRLLDLIRNRTCTFIASESAMKSIQRLYCMQCESKDLKPKSHVGRKVFDRSLQSFVMNRNIRDDLFYRLSNT